MDGIIKFENLDTSYVNLSALIRHLRERSFVGRLHVVLDQYEANVFINGSETPSVRESDHSSGRSAQGKAAMDRLLVRAREPGGLVTLYESGGKAVYAEAPGKGAQTLAARLTAEIEAGSFRPPGRDVDWHSLQGASAELIAAVERAVQSTGRNFANYFSAARIALADDYPFLDPTLGQFEYENFKVRLRKQPAAAAYVSSLTECLRRIVDQLAREKDGVRFRERVAVELAVAARRQPQALLEFTPKLDRIAGTRVL